MLLTNKRKAKLFKLLRFTKLPFLPFVLGIEPGNICNLNCPLCPTGNKEGGMDKGFMPLALFSQIVDQLKDSIAQINLYNWGEPLLNKDLPLMIKYAKGLKPAVRIVMSTNLNVLNRNILDDILGYGIDEIIVSCDGASAETYTKYRVGGNFGLVIENMKYLAQKNRQLNTKADIVWNFLVFSHNEHEVQTAEKMAKELGVKFRIGLMRTSMKDEILVPHKQAIERDKDWIPDNPIYSAYDKNKCAAKKILKTCRKPWQEISVNWDGSVFACCAIFGKQYSFGNVKDNPIKDIWNNTLYAKARKEILIKEKTAPATICGICKNNSFMHM